MDVLDLPACAAACTCSDCLTAFYQAHRKTLGFGRYLIQTQRVTDVCAETPPRPPTKRLGFAVWLFRRRRITDAITGEPSVVMPKGATFVDAWPHLREDR